MDFPLVLSTVGLVTTIYIEVVASNALHLYSECLCWATLTVLLAAAYYCARQGERTQSKEGEAEESSTSFVIAGAILVSCLCRQHGAVTSLMPLVGAALVIGRPRVGPFLMSEQQTGILSDPSSRKTLLVACLATLTLFPSYQTLRASLLALILAIAELIIFNGGSHPDVDDVMLGAREKPYGARYNAYTTSSTFKSIAMPVFCMTALMSLVLAPTESGGFAAIFALAAVKVVRWASLFLLLRASPPEIGPEMSTFAIATKTITAPTWYLQPLAALVTAAYALYQTSHHVQTTPTKRGVICLLILLPLGHFWSDLPIPAVSKPMKWVPYPSTVKTPIAHPVEILIYEAEERYAKAMRHRSQNLAEAVTEYVGRYHRPPPKGFDEWYRIAVSQGVQNIDNYDTVTQAFDLYRALSPRELRDSVQSVLERPEWINSITIEKGQLKFWEEKFPFSEEIAAELEPYLEMINSTEVPMLLNRLHDVDQPRVIVPYEVKQGMMKRRLGATTGGERVGALDGTPFAWLDESARQQWQVLATSCPPDSPLRWQQRHRRPAPGLKFISNASDALDVCQRPELQYLHGSFMSSPRCFVTTQPVPIFSGAKTSVNSDLLIPSPYYRQEHRKFGKDHVSPPWQGKEMALYWSGSNTGVASTELKPHFNWHLSHRNRFVEWANGLGDAAHANMTLLRHGPGRKAWETYTEPLAHQRHLYDVSFSQIVQCGKKACNDIKSFYWPDGSYPGWVERWRTDNYAFLLDIDGNGFSGRFYRLLGSNSTVFKSTIFQEWHDEDSGGGLVPWVHYVPVSIGMEELPELMRFFTSSPRGLELAARIADQGKRWVDERGRPEDISAGTARVILEYRRLVSDGRDTGAMDYWHVATRRNGRWRLGG